MIKTIINSLLNNRMHSEMRFHLFVPVRFIHIYIYQCFLTQLFLANFTLSLNVKINNYYTILSYQNITDLSSQCAKIRSPLQAHNKTEKLTAVQTVFKTLFNLSCFITGHHRFQN